MFLNRIKNLNKFLPLKESYIYSLSILNGFDYSKHYCTLQLNNNLLQKKNNNYLLDFNQKRFKRPKKEKKNKNKEDESSDDEEIEEDEFSDLDIDSKFLKTIDIVNLRFDNVMKASLGLKSSKFIELFSEDKFRLEDNHISKKNMLVQEGQTYDFIESYAGDDPEKLKIVRLHIKYIDPKLNSRGRNILKIEKENLIIDNYPNARFEKINF